MVMKCHPNGIHGPYFFSRSHGHFGRGAPLRTSKRWQHMKIPVKARTAGTRPIRAQRASVKTSNLPKCRLESHVRNESLKGLNTWGKEKYIPEIPHIARKRKHQTPRTLCRSQLIR